MAKKTSPVNNKIKKDGKVKQDGQSAVEQVRQLAWMGQHGKAIDLATQTLSRSGLLPDIQMDLLDLRAESYLAQLNFAAAEKDVKQLERLAKVTDKPALKAQALIRKAHLRAWQDREEDTRRTAKSALKFARQSKQKYLEAEALLWLAWYGLNDVSIRLAQQAADLYLSLNKPSRVGWALNIVAARNINLGRNEEARQIARTALEFCEQAGDGVGKAWSMTILSNMETDLGLAIKLLKQAHQAYEAAGHVVGITVVANNLGYRYADLGLYSRAIRFYRRSFENNPAWDVPYNNITHIEVEQHDLDHARRHVAEARSLTKIRSHLAFVDELAGRIALREENPKVAIKYFKSAIKISHDTETIREIGELALLGQAYLAQGDLTAALKATSKAVKMHRALGFPVVDDHPSQNIWWRHMLALRVNGKKAEAWDALKIAYDFLLQGIVSLKDVGLRRNYLNKVVINKEIMQAWVKENARRKLPDERRFAHLASESNIREPFQRLAEISLQLNTLHSAQEIQTFLVEEATELSGGERVLLILERSDDFSRPTNRATEVATTLEVADSLLPRGEDAGKVLNSIGKHLAQARLTRTVQLILPKNARGGVLAAGGGKSKIVAPLIAQNQILGYLYVDMDSLYGTFDETDRDMMGMLANQAAVALDNARWAQGLEQKVQERTEQLNARVDELAILNSVGEAMAKTLDVKTVTKIVGDKVREIFNSEVTEILLLDSSTNLIHVPYSFYRNYQEIAPFAFGKGLTSRVIKTRNPLILGTNQQQHALGGLRVTEEDKTESYMGVPIITGEKVIGVASVQSYKQNAYTENHLRLLQTLSSNMGVAIQNARLFEAEQQRVAELAVINSIQQGLASKLDFNELFELVGEKLHEIFPRFDIATGPYDPESDLVTPCFLVERGKRLYPQPFKVANVGFFGELLRKPKMIVINQNFHLESARVGSYAIAGTEMPKSSAYVPLLINEKVRGVIVLMEMEREHAISEADVRLLETITSSMSVALENARLFKAEQERVAELAIINSVQEGLASRVDIQGIYDLVGDKLYEIFKTDILYIAIYHPEKNSTSFPYGIVRGKKVSSMPELELGGFSGEAIRKRQTIVVNEDVERRSAEVNSFVMSGDDEPLSLVYVPIIAGESVFGVVSLQSYERGHVFPESDVRLLETLTNSMSVALQNAQSFKAEQERVAELQIINSIQEGLAAELDFQAIVDLVGDKLREVFNMPDLTITWYDEKANLVHYLYLYKHGQRISVPSLSPPPGGIYETEIKTRQPLVLNTAADFAKMNIEVLADTDRSKSYVSVPIISSDRFLGDISIEDDERENAFGESELRLLTTIAASLGTALENARLFDEVQKKNIEISEALEQQTATGEVLRAMSGFQPELRSLLETIAVNVAKVCGADDAHIYRIDNGALKEWTHRGPIPGLEAGESLPLNRGSVIGRAIMDQQIIHIHDAQVELNATEYPLSVSLQRRWGYRTVLATPLLRDGEPIGGIAIRRQEVQPFTDKQIELIKTFADQAVIAIENVRLFDETQRLLKDTQQRNAELAIINAVQRALAAELDLHGIYDAVGEKLREIFDAQTISIYSASFKKRRTTVEYSFEKGQKFDTMSVPFNSLHESIIESDEILLRNGDFPQYAAQFKDYKVPAGEIPLSVMSTTIYRNKEADIWVGVSIQDMDGNRTFGDSDVRLLETVAGAMSVALQNAQSFKAEQERVAELQIINSIQQGLAAELDFQSIVDLVGDKLREVFSSGNISIRWLDRKANKILPLYEYEHGKPVHIEPHAPKKGGILDTMRKTRQPAVFHSAKEQQDFGISLAPGTDASRSAAYIPIIVSDQMVGMVIIEDHERENAYGKSELRLLTTIAASLGTALENARLFDETQRLLKITEDRAAELAIINSVQAALSAELNIQGIYEAVGDKVREIFHNIDVGIRVHDPKTNLVHYPYTYENGERLTIDSEPLPEHGFARHVLHTRETLLIDENMKEAAARYGAVLLPGTQMPKAQLFVPLVTGNQARGIIDLVDMEHEHAFSDSDVRLLQTLANAMSVALENARLFDETQRLLKETEERNAELAIITSVQQALASKLDMQAIYDLIGDKIRQLFDAQVVIIGTLDRQSNLNYLKYAIERGKRISVPPLPIRERLVRYLDSTHQSLVINRDAVQALSEYGFEVLADTDAPKSLIFVPLIVGREVKGMISLQNLDRENAFSESDVRLLQTLANSMSIALENARLFDETQRLLKETEQRAQELAIINSIGQTLTEQLNLNAMVERVGDKLQEALQLKNIGIGIYNEKENIMQVPFIYRDGRRLTVKPFPLNPFNRRVSKAGRSLIVNKDVERLWRKLGGISATEEIPRSFVMVPLMAGRELVGGISLQDFENENAFEDFSIGLLETIASNMGTAILNARLFDETQRLLKETEQRAAELAIINSVQEGLASKLDMQAIFDLVGDKIQSMFNAQSVIISSFDYERQVSRLEYAFEDGQRVYDDELLPLFNPMNKHLIDTRQPVVINENAIEEAKQYGLKIVEGTHAPKSMIFVPFGTGTRVNGYFSLQNLERENAFADSDVRLLQTLAGSMGIALENARLSEKIQMELLQQTQAKEREEHRRVILEKVITTGQHVTEVHDVRTTLMRIWHGVHDDLGFDRLGLYLFNPERNSVDGTFGTNNQGEMIDEWHTWVSLEQDTEEARSFLQVIEKPDTILLTHTYESDNNIPEGHIMSGVQDFAAIGAWAGTKPVAVICVDHKITRRRITDEQLEALRLFAGYAGLAIENARLFDETQRLLKETKQRNAELAIINNISQALASQLDLQAMTDLVGDKLLEVFHTQDAFICLYDRSSNLLEFPYSYTLGVRDDQKPMTLGQGLTSRVITTRLPLVINHDFQKRAAELGVFLRDERDLPVKAWMGVPIIVSDQVIGVIGLLNLEREHAFSDLDVRLLETLASNMGVAIQNARLFQAEKQRATELAVINSISQSLASRLDFETSISLVGEKLEELFGAQYIYIALYNQTTNRITFPYFWADGQLIEDDTELEFGGGVTSHVLRTRQPLLINSDASRHLSELGAVIVSYSQSLKSSLIVPILANEQAIGTVALQSSKHENLFTESDVRLLTTIASNIGVSLQNARLFNETQHLLKETEARAQELAAISTVSQALVAETELDAMIQLIGSQTRETFQADIAYLALLDPQTNRILFPYQHGEGFTSLKLGEGLTSKIIQSGEPLLINKDLKGRRAQMGTTLVGRESLSYLGVPIKSGKETIGVLSVQSVTEEGVFDDADLHLLTTIAANAGAAIQTAQLHAETERRAREMATLAEVGRDISSSLEASTVLQGIAKHAKELLNGNLSALFIPEGNGTIFRAIAAVGEEAQQVRNDTIRMGEGLLGDLARRRVGEIVNNTNADPRTILIQGTEEVPDEHLLAVPLLANDELKGLMAVWRTGKGKEFIEPELEFLNNLARQAVIAIQNTQLFEEAKEARAAAEHANKAKSTFLANMSHELRTPLNAIIGFTRIVRKKSDGLLPVKQLENLDKVLTSSEHLLGLINTVLDIAKIEAGRMEVIPGNFSISALADQCANLAMPLLKPNVILEKQVDVDLGIIYSDQDKIKQIVLNLLSNAAKFTHEGQITLAVVKPDEDSLRISVADSGIGISEEALARIFDEFQQADASTTRQYGGTGLGLAISRNLARLLGGDLTATSELGKGSTFSLTIPMYYGRTTVTGTHVPAGQGTESYSQTDAAKKRILVIDDDPDAAYLLQESLNLNEFAVIGAPNGHTGLQLARESQPDAILLDILMPETDGWQILNDLKMEKATLDIPVILLTIVDKKALGFKLGAAAYLLKPLNPTVVLETLRRVIGEKNHPHKHVLVVDDDPNVAEMLRQTLPESDFVLASAEDGEAGLLAIEVRRPDVILLDLMMPKLDGFGVIERLRTDSELRNIPIIVISAKDLTEEESRTLKESVAFVMKKQGFNGDLLVQEINSAVKKPVVE